MTELNKKLINLINEKKTINEICEIMSISHKQLYHRLSMLKFKGIDFRKKYYEDGTIKLYVKDRLDNDENILLRTDKNKNEITIAFIADIHMANKQEIERVLDSIYNFCTINNIHTIVNAGDILDGIKIHSKSKDDLNYEQQLEYLFKHYPFDKNILNFICLGNHDLEFLEEGGINISEALKMKRYDLVPIGYGIGKIDVKDDHFLVVHPKTTKETYENEDIVFHGHHHRNKLITGNNNIIHIPTLSNLALNNNILPGFITCTFKFNDGIIESLYLTNYVYVNDKFYIASENKIHIQNTDIKKLNKKL